MEDTLTGYNFHQFTPLPLNAWPFDV